MRVLTVGNLYPPHHFGGYEQVWQSAVEHLRAGGHAVRVLAADFRRDGVADGDEPDVHRTLRWYLRDQRPHVVPIPERLRTERHNHRELRRHLHDHAPDVVSFWSMGGMSHSLIEAVRRGGLPMVAFVHDQWLDYGRGFDLYTRMFAGRPRAAARVAERLTGVPAVVDYARAGRYVFVSDFVRRRALTLDHGPAERDTAVAHSGIDPLFLEGGAPERAWRWRLLHAGRLHPDKGIDDAVDALALLPERATLTFAGTWDAREASALDERVARLGLGDRVSMLGHRSHAELARLYREHDAVLFGVRWDEPWGLVPLEAMACGCPVVATARGGSAEYLRDGENCLVVAAHDPEAIAGAVRRLAGDEDLRARLREGGRAAARRYTEPLFNAAVERHLSEAAR